ncbi:hypothetical protein PHYBLDRAFT_167005 [Phycomyces blakesleeanus NRRL 1555(-)]|uniref:Uncharacterized protein n=1 Tax=Phycomyces blakesleeanus (strain ATCC 8743b / DSM 1359 / FGSC 10004 / NBRC 33097 / NRRL 1555) TaxID=763407 RepID=A0A162XG45_PHYB8|nr:hypothetical protein PHYBLDRAFT_167005 [Phycomyces blakesleeanus NRRL 1555(-)]OAD74655.1 hypothetical protein PHYBLDRAFT_167005 [Phycomyces blakesleeanus NRRL 1555(-)]|eukprot:XP_018292695.1 hypothetical protein PHYBLDRAFT_167005 [Phycomyces blakesleeanus NRRL 1555(-)]
MCTFVFTKVGIVCFEYIIQHSIFQLKIKVYGPSTRNNINLPVFYDIFLNNIKKCTSSKKRHLWLTPIPVCFAARKLTPIQHAHTFTALNNVNQALVDPLEKNYSIHQD